MHGPDESTPTQFTPVSLELVLVDVPPIAAVVRDEEAIFAEEAGYDEAAVTVTADLPV